jgi:hypothetical protein
VDSSTDAPDNFLTGASAMPNEEAIYVLPISRCNTKGFKKVRKMEDYFWQGSGKTYSRRFQAFRCSGPFQNGETRKTTSARLVGAHSAVEPLANREKALVFGRWSAHNIGQAISRCRLVKTSWSQGTKQSYRSGEESIYVVPILPQPRDHGFSELRYVNRPLGAAGKYYLGARPGA